MAVFLASLKLERSIYIVAYSQSWKTISQIHNVQNSVQWQLANSMIIQPNIPTRGKIHETK